MEQRLRSAIFDQNLFKFERILEEGELSPKAVEEAFDYMLNWQPNAKICEVLILEGAKLSPNWTDELDLYAVTEIDSVGVLTLLIEKFPPKDPDFAEKMMHYCVTQGAVKCFRMLQSHLRGEFTPTEEDIEVAKENDHRAMLRLLDL